MVVLSQLAALRNGKLTLSSLSSLFVLMIVVTIDVNVRECRDETSPTTVKYLNVKCDFERIPGGGCHLRESYCNLHNVQCVCKPDSPINIADRLCISRHRKVLEPCIYSEECQSGSICSSHSSNNSRVCVCKTGHVYSVKSKQCVKGLKGSQCQSNADCGANEHCIFSMCDCKLGFVWFATDEVCHKKLRHNEPCDGPISCKMHDEFSDCDPITKRCACGQFLSRKYALDEVTQKCVTCPPQRHQNANNTCLPEKLTVEYSSLDGSGGDRSSHQQILLTVVMPLIVLVLIGFIYRHVKLSNNFVEQQSTFEVQQRMLDFARQNELCLPIDMSNTEITAVAAASVAAVNQHGRTSHSNLALICSPLIPADPPPTYDIAALDLPPSYDQAVGRVA